MAIIGILATLAIPSFIGAMKSAREAVLREDLHIMRAAIDSYTMDKQKAPQSLEDLIQDGYLRSIRKTDDTQQRYVGDGYERCALFSGPDGPGHQRCALRIAGNGYRRAGLLDLVDAGELVRGTK